MVGNVCFVWANSSEREEVESIELIVPLSR